MNSVQVLKKLSIPLQFHIISQLIYNTLCIWSLQAVTRWRIWTIDLLDKITPLSWYFASVIRLSWRDMYLATPFYLMQHFLEGLEEKQEKKRTIMWASVKYQPGGSRPLTCSSHIRLLLIQISLMLCSLLAVSPGWLRKAIILYPSQKNGPRETAAKVFASWINNL